MRSGDTFSIVLTVKGGEGDSQALIDFTGCAAEMQIVSTYGVAPIYSLKSGTSTANGGSLTLGDEAGTVSITIPPADTLLLADGSYDLKIKYADETIQTIFPATEAAD